MTPLLLADEAQVRGVGTDMADDDLQAIIDAEEALMVRRFGAHGTGVATVTEVLMRQGRNVYPPRPFVSVSSVKTAPYPGGSLTTLASTDYYTWAARGYVELYPGGLLIDTIGEAVTLVYVPVDDRALRKEVLLNLVKLTIADATLPVGRVSGMGFSIEGGGDQGETRAALYRKLGYFEV